jgi:predicted RNA-binding Zn-ribbon protein involved in translation (DUF1610 family)
MGENYHAPGWKIPFGSIDQIQHFEENGKSHLRKFSELFYWCFKISQIVKKGYSTDVLAKNLIKAYDDCRKHMKYYLMGAVFLIDIDAQTSLESLNRIYNVILEMNNPNQIFTSGLIHIFLGYVYSKLERDLSSQRAFQKALEIFPTGNRFRVFAQQQLHGERTFKDWVLDALKYFELNDGRLLTNLLMHASSINEEDFQNGTTEANDELSILDYEKKFIEQHKKEKKANTHVRRCGSCGYFLISEGIGEKKCPQCQKTMNFVLYCPTCGIWYNVKTHKKYMCPTCGNLMEKKEKI